MLTDLDPIGCEHSFQEGKHAERGKKHAPESGHPFTSPV